MDTVVMCFVYKSLIKFSFLKILLDYFLGALSVSYLCLSCEKMYYNLQTNVETPSMTEFRF